MRTKIEEFNGTHVSIRFFPDSEHEQKALSAFKNNRANDSIELNVIGRVEKAILSQGLGQYSVTGFNGVQNNIYYIFQVQRIGGLGH
ncbi:hypothetical protein [Marivirga arenosa]|uniref:Uncharacterized protein n=1 Tax=Marivirga arenosa TaxID=3059076 RepID=A0AA49GEC2_9BACT|nr:hypothetical protein [Marivirga sp. BKB1-2]WKK80381.1 hypothetical protein QYS47_25015 [Marivirga sp. BKB1-2]WKK80394.1 hypothetical protein QYS47_25085 [Marivirga sp. BKB1-2]WKK80406.1 hypothetical protein QYS47_25150 [Marivirga sp. BKB1-2]WKK80418.1 hypothetical protein QYS47_25220 [Marivirga sp. BKB1-2]